MLTGSESGSRHAIGRIIRSLLTALGFFLIYYAVRIVISDAVTIFLLSRYDDVDKAISIFNQNANAISLLCNIAVIIVFFAVLSLQRRSITDTLHLKKVCPSIIFLSLFSGIFLNVVTSNIISLLPESLLDKYSEATATVGNGSVVWFILSAVIAAPIVEELVFRALIASSLTPGFGRVLSVIISSLVFGAVHTGPVWFTYAFALGCVLACVFVRTGSVYSSIALHFGFNLMNLFPYLSFIVKNKKTLETIYSTLTYFSLPLAVLLIFLIFFITRSSASNESEDVQRI